MSISPRPCAARSIQELYLGGKKLEAIRSVPAELIDSISIAGPARYVEERLAAWSDAGVTMLLAAVQGPNQAHRLQTLEILTAGARAVH